MCIFNNCSKVSSRDIYKRLCECRDFEIKLQWERAVFLTAFLIACFSGYGAFLLSVHQHGNGCLSAMVVKLIPICISFVGMILSLFWIMMAKGSKAWYEHYESAIKAYAQKIGDGCKSSPVSSDVLSHHWISLDGIKRADMSDSLVKLNGGCYSVSKIVIAIGMLSLAIWFALFLVHLAIAVFGPISGWKCVHQIRAWGLCPRLDIILFACCPVYIMKWITSKIKSGYLNKVKSQLPEDKTL